jgi:hypothetical protein
MDDRSDPRGFAVFAAALTITLVALNLPSSDPKELLS